MWEVCADALLAVAPVSDRYPVTYTGRALLPHVLCVLMCYFSDRDKFSPKGSVLALAIGQSVKKTTRLSEPVKKAGLKRRTTS